MHRADQQHLPNKWRSSKSSCGFSRFSAGCYHGGVRPSHSSSNTTVLSETFICTKAKSFGWALSSLPLSGCRYARSRRGRSNFLPVWMQCDISLHSAFKLAFQSLNLAYPSVCFSCSSNALTAPSASLTFLSSRDKVRNAKHGTNAVRGHPSSFFLCHRALCASYTSKFFPQLTLGSWCLVGEALRQEKVTSSQGHQSPSERKRDVVFPSHC